MPNLLRFVHAVFAHWISLVGVVLTAMSFIQPWIEKRFPKTRVFKGLWAVGVALLLVALYDAWLDEHHNAEVLISERARLFFQQCGASGGTS